MRGVDVDAYAIRMGGRSQRPMLTTYYLLLTTSYLLLTTYYLLLTTDYLLLTADYLLLTTDYLLPTMCGRSQHPIIPREEVSNKQ